MERTTTTRSNNNTKQANNKSNNPLIKSAEKSKLESYPLIQEIIGPIYLNYGKNNSINLARIQKVQSKICKNVFDKGNKNNFRMLKDVPDIKFWNQRYYYYSKFDEGIQMDFESKLYFRNHIRILILYYNINRYIKNYIGWYSVTPEDLAYFISYIAGPDSVCIDPFSGSGGNVIQFSKNCKKVYAVDIDINKIEICKNNCKVYDCPNNINLILSDFLLLDIKNIFDNNNNKTLNYITDKIETKDKENNNINNIKNKKNNDYSYLYKNINKKIKNSKSLTSSSNNNNNKKSNSDNLENKENKDSNEEYILPQDKKVSFIILIISVIMFFLVLPGVAWSTKQLETIPYVKWLLQT